MVSLMIMTTSRSVQDPISLPVSRVCRILLCAASLWLVGATCSDPISTSSTPATDAAVDPALIASETPIDDSSVADAAPQPVSDPRELLSRVVVDRVELDYSAPAGPERPRLWDLFANRPYHEQFSAITTENWYENWQLYERRIIELADLGGHDKESLGRCFESVRPPADADTAFLPIGAFLARRGDEPVWIIVANWEWSPMSTNFSASTQTPLIARMGHIRAWAFTARDCEQIDFMTCG